jgi:hypothetical protein
MSAEKNIDQIFNEGLQGSGLAYHNAHWEGMNAVLDENIPVAKWPAVKLAKYLAFVILLISLGFYFGFNQGKKEVTSSIIPANDAKVEPTAPNITASKSQRDEEEKSKVAMTEILNEIDEIENEQAQYYSHQPTEKSSEISTQKMAETLIDNKPSIENSSGLKSPSAYSTINPITKTLSIEDKPKKHVASILELGDIEVYLTKQTEKTEQTEQKQAALPVLSSVLVAKRFEGTFTKSTSSAIALQSITKDLLPIQRKRWSLYVEPWAGYVKNSRSLSATLLNGLKLEESPENRWSYGANVLLRKRKWAIKSGLEVQRYRESLSYLTESTSWSYDTTLRIVKKNYGQTGSGNTLALLDEIIDSTSTSQINACQDCSMEVSFLSIPVSLQYFHQIKRFTIYGELGASYALRRSVNGDYTTLSNDGNWQLNEAKQEIKESWLGAKVGGGLMFTVTPKVNIFSGLEINRSLTSLTKAYNQQLQQTNFKAGIQVKVW